MAELAELAYVAGIIFDALSAFLFCCVISLFVIPTIIDRAIFYIPRMIFFTVRGEVSQKGIWYCAGEMLFWLVVLFGLYGYFFFFQPSLFAIVTLSVPAIAAWIIGAIFIIFRIVNFRGDTRDDYYQISYSRFITPSARKAYQEFNENLARLNADEITALLAEDLPYLQHRAALRKFYELRDI